MGYKRCHEANELENLSLNKAKRLERSSELVSLADIFTPNNAFGKTVSSGDNEDGFYNIQWYDPLETDPGKESPYAGDKNAQTIGHFNSCSSEEDTGSGATSLSSASSDYLEIDIPQKASVPVDDDYLAFDCSPRKPVPLGPNHQATIPVWRGKVNKMLKLGIYNHAADSASSGLEPALTVDEDEERLMGTSVLSMHEPSFYSSTNGKIGQGRRTECKCLDQGSIRCVRQHVKEARENLREILGKENFVNFGFNDMGEDVAQEWTEEEEDMFHEVVYNNPASLGRNFWKHLPVAFPSRTNKEIVSYYFNVFMLRRRATQNRSRYLDIDSDDDEFHARNVSSFGFENSEDDSAIESLGGDQDVHIENEDNYSDEDEGDDDNSDDGTESNVLGLTGSDMGNTTEEEGVLDQRLSKCKVNSQIEIWSSPAQRADETSVMLKNDIGVQDDSCMSFECDANMGVFCHSNSLLDASMEPWDAKHWYPAGYSTCPSTTIDLLPTSNLIEEIFNPSTSDNKTRCD